MNHNTNNITQPSIFLSPAAKEFKKLLKAKNVNISGLSKTMGFSKNYLAEILAGRKNLTQSIRDYLNGYLGTDIQD